MPSVPAESSAWPCVSWESRSWTPSVSSDALSRRAHKRHQGHYRAALVARIADAHPYLPNAVAALAAEASAAIARFDAEVGAEVAPFATVLLRSESAASSMIENLTSGTKAIVLAEMGSRDKHNATEIVGNVAAMKAAINLADRLDAAAILAMHDALMRNYASDIAGKWRRQQVWIGGDCVGPHGAMFVPPHHDHIAHLIDDLVAFTRRTDLPLLTHAAIAHAQFETIHPFSDGNGRTGRALVHAMLRGHGLTRKVTVPVSAGLLGDTNTYFHALTAYRNGDLEPIVAMMANASFAAIDNGRRLVTELHDVRASWNDRVKARRGAMVWRLAELLLRQPVVDTAMVAAELGISPDNAARPITPLVRAGVLTEFTGFARNRMWQSQEVLAALDSFAARAIRRTAD